VSTVIGHRILFRTTSRAGRSLVSTRRVLNPDRDGAIADFVRDTWLDLEQMNISVLMVEPIVVELDQDGNYPMPPD